MYQRRMPIKLAFLGESTGIFSIGWVIKQLFHAPRLRGQLDAALPSAFRPRAIVHRAVQGTSGQQF